MNLYQPFISESYAREKACCFFGHRDAPYRIRNLLYQEIEYLVISGSADVFYVGNQGAFDRMVYGVLKEIKEKYSCIEFYVVLAYMPDANTEKLFGNHTIYPEGLETIHKRFAIPYRNDWLIHHSSHVICYITRSTGGAFRYVEKAKRKGLNIINIRDKEDMGNPICL